MKSKITVKEVADYLSKVSIEDDQVDGDVFKSSQEELDAYHISHARRFCRSLQLIQQWAPPVHPLRILELGAAPYYFTTLLRRYIDCEVVGVNIEATIWPGADSGDAPKREVSMRQGEAGEMMKIPIHVFNIEKDPFPFPTAAFDMALFMEVVEHLAYSPTHTLAEVHRVLKPGGRLFLSTPNAVDMRRTVAPLINRSSGFHYSGYGIYGRHNREFTVKELSLLTTACGYRVLDSRLENVFIRTHYSLAKRLPFQILNLLSGLPLPYLRAKREYIFLIAESTGQPRWAYPESLYFYPHLYPSGEQHE
jgi:SAM-dependent methyltransferase